MKKNKKVKKESLKQKAIRLEKENKEIKITEDLLYKIKEILFGKNTGFYFQPLEISNGIEDIIPEIKNILTKIEIYKKEIEWYKNLVEQTFGIDHNIKQEEKNGK